MIVIILSQSNVLLGKTSVLTVMRMPLDTTDLLKQQPAATKFALNWDEGVHFPRFQSDRVLVRCLWTIPIKAYETGPLGLPSGVWYHGVGSRSFGFCRLQRGALMDQLVPVHPTDAWPDWELGNLEAWSLAWALPDVPLVIFEQNRRARCPAGWTTTGCSVASRWMPGPEGSLAVTICPLLFTSPCQWFECSGWSVYIYNSWLAFKVQTNQRRMRPPLKIYSSSRKKEQRTCHKVFPAAVLWTV